MKIKVNATDTETRKTWNWFRSKSSFKSTWTMSPWCSCSCAPFVDAPNPLYGSAVWQVLNAFTLCGHKVLKRIRLFLRKIICSLGNLWFFGSCRRTNFDTALNVMQASLDHFVYSFSAMSDIKPFICSLISAKWRRKVSELQFTLCTSSPTKGRSRPTRARCLYLYVSHSLLYSYHSCQVRIKQSCTLSD